MDNIINIGKTAGLLSSIGYRKAKNNIFKILVMVFSFLTISMVFLIIGTLLVKGYKQINLAFFTQVAPDRLSQEE